MTSQSVTTEVLKGVQNNVTCSICSTLYTDPKMLSCQHVFCKKCLNRLVSQQQGKPTINCPFCRKNTILSSEGVEGLQSAHHLQEVLDLENELRQRLENIPTCERHQGEEICFYCEPCSALICKLCIVDEQDESGHRYKTVEDVCKVYREDLSVDMEAAKMSAKKMEAKLQAFDERETEILEQQKELVAEVKDMVTKLQEALDSKASALIDQIQDATTSKVSSLHQKKSELNVLQSGLENSIMSCQNLLDDKNQKEIIVLKDKFAKLVSRSSEDCLEADTSPPEEANLGISSHLESSLASIGNFAAIKTCNVYPPNCYATGSSLSSAYTGETSNLTVNLMDRKSQPCPDSIGKVNLELKADSSTVERGVIGKVKRSHCEMIFTPKVKGYHQLSITIKGKHIRDSPFRTAVKPRYIPSSLLAPNSTIITVQNPTGVALCHNGNFLVVSETESYVSMVKQDGTLVREVRKIGPFADIAVGDDGSVYVISMLKNCIERYSPEATFLETTGEVIETNTMPKGLLKFNAPRGIAFNSTRKKLVVSNTGTHEIVVLSADLAHYMTFGGEGAKRSQFLSPRGICCDNMGRIVVADSGNDRIQVFTAEGRFVQMFGQRGEQSGSLNCPVGVACDSSRRIYVSESENNRVSIFTSSGNIIKCIGGEGVMKEPLGVAVDSNCGTMLVCNCGYNLVQIY